MADRHICPVCDAERGTITIHDNLYICGQEDCGVLWNPQADDPDPHYPIEGAIGFCPRCGDRGERMDILDNDPCFECDCGYDWCDDRLDGKGLAIQLGYIDSVYDFPDTPDEPLVDVHA